MGGAAAADLFSLPITPTQVLLSHTRVLARTHSLTHTRAHAHTHRTREGMEERAAGVFFFLSSSHPLSLFLEGQSYFETPKVGVCIEAQATNVLLISKNDMELS